MKKLLVVCALTFMLAEAASVFGQQTAAPAATPSVPASGGGTQSSDGVTLNGVIGEVAVIDASGKQMFVKTAAGAVIVVALDASTKYERVAPGAKDRKNAVSIAVGDVSVGDRVYALGKVADDRKSVPARLLIVMSKADISKKEENDRAEWRNRGIVGNISALNPQTKEITLQMRGRGPVQQIVVAASADTVKFRRYAPDSVKFAEAKQSSFAELKIGDQLRALGEKSTDGTRFTPQEVVSGTFRTMFGTVSVVNAQANEIKIKDMQSQQETTVVVSKDSMARRIPAEFAQMMAMRGQGGGGPGRTGRRGEGAPQGQGPAAGDTARPAAGGPGADGAPRGANGGPRRMMGGGGGDLSEMLERLPEVSIAELKPGDTLLISSTAGSDPSRVTAIHLIAGADALINMMQQRRAISGPNMAGTGMSGLGIDFGIGLP